MTIISPFFGYHPNHLLAKLAASDLSRIRPHLAALMLNITVVVFL
jgi:hypothetical protein